MLWSEIKMVFCPQNGQNFFELVCFIFVKRLHWANSTTRDLFCCIKKTEREFLIYIRELLNVSVSRNALQTLPFIYKQQIKRKKGQFVWTRERKLPKIWKWFHHQNKAERLLHTTGVDPRSEKTNWAHTKKGFVSECWKSNFFCHLQLKISISQHFLHMTKKPSSQNFLFGFWSIGESN